MKRNLQLLQIEARRQLAQTKIDRPQKQRT
jgi:hypothetical protein